MAKIHAVCLTIMLLVAAALFAPKATSGQVNAAAVGVGKNPSANGSLMAFSTQEVAIQLDLNADGDMSDTIVQYYDFGTGTVVNTGVVGDNPSVFAKILVFATREGSISTDLNGDGDMFDSIIRYFNTTSATLFNTMAAGENPRSHGDLIVFQGPDLKIKVYRMSLHLLEDSEVYGSNPSVFGSMVSLSTSETLVNQDLNGDGVVDPFTSVVRFYDVVSRTVVNTGQLGDRTSTYGSMIAFDYALNAPIFLYNTTSGAATDTTVAGFTPALYGDRVFLENGTIKVYEISTGRVDDTRIDGTNPSAFKNIVGFETDENIVNRDLNGDHIVKDVIIRYAAFTPLMDAAVSNLYTSGVFVLEPSMAISVVVVNLGEARQSFDVMVFWNSTSIGVSLGLVLDPQASATLGFEWNTLGLYPGAYVLSAGVSVVAGEAETVNNVFSLNLVKVCSLQSDVNGDGIVNILDLATVGGVFGSAIGSQNYVSYADLNEDGVINIVDLALVGSSFGISC